MCAIRPQQDSTFGVSCKHILIRERKIGWPKSGELIFARDVRVKTEKVREEHVTKQGARKGSENTGRTRGAISCTLFIYRRRATLYKLYKLYKFIVARVQLLSSVQLGCCSISAVIKRALWRFLFVRVYRRRRRSTTTTTTLMTLTTPLFLPVTTTSAVCPLSTKVCSSGDGSPARPSTSRRPFVQTSAG